MAKLGDFFVRIGFDVDEQSAAEADRKIDEHEKKTTRKVQAESDRREKDEIGRHKRSGERYGSSIKQFESYALRFTGIAAAMGALTQITAMGIVSAVDRAATSLRNLGVMTARSGSSPGTANAFAYAVQQTGGSRDAAMASIQVLGQRLKDNPRAVADQIKARYGVNVFDAQGRLRDTAAIEADIARQLPAHVQRQGYMSARGEAESIAGMDQETFQSVMSPDFQRRMREAQDIQRRTGNDPDATAASATKFTQSMEHLSEVFGNIKEKVEKGLFDTIGPQLDRLATWATDHAQEISDKIVLIIDKLVELVKQVAIVVAKFTAEEGLTNVLTLLGVAIAAKLLGPLGGLVGMLAKLGGFAVPRVLTALLTILGFGPAAAAAFAVAAAGLGMEYNKTHGDRNPADDAPHPPDEAHEDFIGKAWRNRPKWLGGTGGAGKDKWTPSTVDPGGSSAGSLTELINKEAAKAGIDPRIMQGIRAGESGHGANYDKKDDALESSWGPFQLNRRRGLGVQFEKENPGLDVRDPRTIAAQVRWVANFIKKGGSLGNWMGYHGPRDADPRWGNSGYAAIPEKAAGTEVASADTKAKIAPPTDRFRWGRVGAGDASDKGLMANDTDLANVSTSTRGLPPLGGGVVNNSRTRGDTNVTNNYNVQGGGNPLAALEAARYSAGRGTKDLLRNLQSAE